MNNFIVGIIALIVAILGGTAWSNKRKLEKTESQLKEEQSKNANLEHKIVVNEDISNLKDNVWENLTQNKIKEEQQKQEVSQAENIQDEGERKNEKVNIVNDLINSFNNRK